MFDIQKVKDALFTVNSFVQTDNTAELELDPSVWGTAESGINYNEADHVQLQLENLRYISPYSEGWNYIDFSATTTYAIGDIVRDPNNTIDLYVSIQAGVGNPLTDVAFWTRKYPFSEWLESKLKFYCNKFVNTLVVRKKLNQYTKTLFADARLFLNSGNIKDTETPQGRFVGFKIQLNQYQNTQLEIKQIGLQMNQTQTDLPIYLYHSSQLEPLSVNNVTTTRATSFQWVTFTTPLILDFTNDTIDAGGFYYIGYYEADLAGSAIKKQFTGTGPCQTCGGGEAANFNKYRPHVLITPFHVQAGNLDPSRDYWDVTFDVDTTNQNWGLNLNFSTFCDITDYVVKNRAIFANALVVQLAAGMYKEVVNSDRDSTFKGKMKSQALFNLSEQGLDISKELNQEIDALSFDLSDLESPCAPREKLKAGRVVRKSA